MSEYHKHLLIYIGGKFYLARWIASHFPPHKVYVEPFAGGAHVLLKKPPSEQEVLADTNFDVINLYRQCRTNYQLLSEKTKAYHQYQSTADNKNNWLHLRADWKEGKIPEGDLDRAALFWYLHNHSWSGNFLASYSGHSKTSPGYGNKVFTSKVSNAERFVARIKDVSLLVADFEQTIQMFDSPDTLFYCDPPYIGTSLTKKDGKEYYNSAGFPHDRLAKILNSIQGKACISYYPHPSLLELYPDWRVVSKMTRLNAYQKPFGTAGVVEAKHNSKVELLLMNYPLPPKVQIKIPRPVQIKVQSQSGPYISKCTRTFQNRGALISHEKYCIRCPKWNTYIRR